MENRWISVEESIPDKGERVLVFGEEIGVRSVAYYIDRNGRWVDSYGCIAPPKVIEYWQPLPPPPNTNNNVH